MAAQRATAADKELLERIMDEMHQAHRADNPQMEAKVDVEFHSTIGECAHNIILLHTLRSCYRLLSDDVFYNREKIYGGQGARDRLLEQHTEIFNCVMKGQADAACDAARNHIRYVEQATREVEQKVDWDVISQLRLAQRNEAKRPRLSRAKSTTNKNS